ncbi:MAG: hypothetical protein J7M38_05175, partial [Armatimonadetes bacterium]|nr:hypothetical protein [Armatimonadota bacterium]
PDMILLTYKNGPTRYNTAPWGQIGEGWEWMKAHHGRDAADRWIALGAVHGGYLQSPFYPNERLMIPGNPNWQRYWIENVYQDLWGGRAGIDVDGMDGIFSDNTNYHLPTNWHTEGNPDQQDLPATYAAGGEPLRDKWRDDMDTFLNQAVPELKDRGVILAPNFGPMGNSSEDWLRLDALAHPPETAMDESGFICPYGAGSFNTWAWEKAVRTMCGLKHVRVLVNGQGVVHTDAEGLSRMDVLGETNHSYKDRMTGWEALWFSITSFLMGFDDVRGNAYMNFTVWGYSEYHWLDEFDPHYLHLGRALGEMQEIAGETGSVYVREFEDGWAVVNAKWEDARAVPVPEGRARVIDHSNFKSPEDAPLVTRFDLPLHRGIVLLREGHDIGNSDNQR